jgi:DNA-binding SARP family transcriptional activator
MMDFRMLGPVEVWSAERRVDLGRGEAAKARTLLAVLMRSPGELVSTDALVERVWDERPPSASVRYKYVGWLRSALARSGVKLVLRDGGYMLQVQAEQVDVHRFRGLIARARRVLAGGGLDEAPRLIDEGLRLWRGQALAGLSGTWIELYRGQLAREQRDAQVLRARCMLDLGFSAATATQLAELESEHPTDEEIVGLRMVALARCGQTAEAVWCYQRAEKRLRTSMDVGPGPYLQDLLRRVQNRDTSLDRGALAASE